MGLLLAGCAATPADSAAAARELPAGMSAELIQLRSDVAARQAEVRIVNGTGEPIEVGAVSVADPRFRAPAERVVDRTSTLAPGATVDVRVQLGAAACGVAAEPAATLTLRGARGDEPFAAVVPIAEAIPFLAALHERECVQEGAERSADIALGVFTPSDAGAPAALELQVAPRPGDGVLRITGIRETNLLTFDGVVGGALALDIDQTGADRSAQSVSLPLRPARCDPHAVLEDKRGTVFRLLVEVDGVAGSFDLAASPELRGELLGWVARWCGYGS
ncbi:hypothetical protein N3K63_05170 [Microbacterium sp. W1N]|uniref:hypothetical protein n=1 Tax=Microbacterium festucae TaxID=2977531 RepID=UPI0021C2265F|nr:hypothetical protein [Microbacterium festucae]MCT9819675.1 hypothetical protein [Microbacterium festucae]